MSNPVDFSNVPAIYRTRPNKVEYVRIEILGMGRPELMAVIHAHNATLSFSTGTLKNIEREDGGNETSRTKLHKGINHALKLAEYELLTKEALYKPFDNRPAK